MSFEVGMFRSYGTGDQKLSSFQLVTSPPKFPDYSLLKVLYFIILVHSIRFSNSFSCKACWI